jgi:hypothetical protein
MTINWYHNSKTGEIESYEKESAGYELKGVLYAYGDAVTIGFNSKEEAIAWSKEWGYCPKCDGSSKPRDGKCFRCETPVIFKELQNIEDEIKIDAKRCDLRNKRFIAVDDLINFIENFEIEKCYPWHIRKSKLIEHLKG